MSKHPEEFAKRVRGVRIRKGEGECLADATQCRVGSPERLSRDGQAGLTSHGRRDVGGCHFDEIQNLVEPIDQPWASNTVASAQTGCLGWSVSGAGSRSERAELGRLAMDGVISARTARPDEEAEIRVTEDGE
jgi:hypothetical protein